MKQRADSLKKINKITKLGRQKMREALNYQCQEWNWGFMKLNEIEFSFHRSCRDQKENKEVLRTTLYTFDNLDEKDQFPPKHKLSQLT